MLNIYSVKVLIISEDKDEPLELGKEQTFL
jgi:hypothetical protein